MLYDGLYYFIMMNLSILQNITKSAFHLTSSSCPNTINFLPTGLLVNGM